MDSSAPFNGHATNVPLDHSQTSSLPIKTPSSRRTQSFSSSSSLSSCSSSLEGFASSDDSPNSPTTPLQFSGIPFSWEHFPGIPKKQASRNLQHSSMNLLPLPPAATTAAPSRRFHFDQEAAPLRKKYNSTSFRRDPFFAALIECSKDDHETFSDIWKPSSSTKASRNSSDRLGFIDLYASCKRTCAVSESIVYLPRSSKSGYDYSNRRSA
ncbi:hypothetical protein RJ641_029298 [Dillenia turbinata]|uniref:Uncharacterized protein n=1 Tax=Dillenia turbinata TaxID=194707 RepID=A0AAN8ZJB2_9MAGN